MTLMMTLMKMNIYLKIIMTNSVMTLSMRRRARVLLPKHRSCGLQDGSVITDSPPIVTLDVSNVIRTNLND